MESDSANELAWARLGSNLVKAVRRPSALILYAATYAASAGVLKLFGFLVFMWLARQLPVGEYASFGLAYALQTGMATFAGAGVVEVIIGRLSTATAGAERAQLYASGSVVFFAMLLPASIAMIAVAFLDGSSWSSQALVTISALAVGGIAAYANLQAQIVRFDERHVASLLLSFLFPFTIMCGGAVGFLIGGSVESFFLGSLVGSLGAVVALAVVHRKAPFSSARMDLVAPLLRKLSPFVAIAILGWFSGYGSNYFVGMLFNPGEIARFTFLLTISSVLQLVATALNQVWSPRFFKGVADGNIGHLESGNRAFFGLQAIAMGAIGAIVIAAYPLLIAAIGGNLVSYRDNEFELALLFAAYVVLCPWWHSANYFLVFGKGGALASISLATSLVGVSAWFLLMWALGVRGIYLGFLVQMLLRSLAIVFVAKRHWPVKTSWEGVVGGLTLLYLGYLASLHLSCSIPGVPAPCAE